jgi:peroxiredoxin Q/BCP
MEFGVLRRAPSGISWGRVLAVSERLRKTLRPGDEAPDFRARLSTGEEVRLSDYRGRESVVLSFYPKDFTPGCTRQAYSYRDHYARVRELGAVILGVSIDSEERHRRFASACQLPYPLISDPAGELCALYGAARGGLALFGARRITYVIDRNGIIRLATHHEFLVGKHLEEVLSTLEKLQRADFTGSHP